MTVSMTSLVKPHMTAESCHHTRLVLNMSMIHFTNDLQKLSRLTYLPLADKDTYPPQHTRIPGKLVKESPGYFPKNFLEEFLKIIFEEKMKILPD